MPVDSRNPVAVDNPGTAAARLGSVLGRVEVTNPKGLRRWRAAYGDHLFTPAKVWCVGDSIWWGVGSANIAGGDAADDGEEYADGAGWPGQLRSIFANEVATNPAGALLTRNHIAQGSTGADARVVGAGTLSPIASVGLMGIRSINNTSNGGSAGTWTFNLPKCTAFTIVYWEATSTDSQNGEFTYAVDGGSAVTATRVSPFSVYKTVEVTGLSDATHTVVVTATQSNNVQIPFIFYHSEKGVVVGRFGKPGWTIRDMIGDGTNSGVQTTEGKLRLQKGLTAGSPHLVVIGFGHNDAVQQLTTGQLTTVEYHKTTLQAQVDAIVAAGSCVLLVSSPWPRTETVPSGGSDFDAYWTARDEVAAATDHCAHLRIADVWGDAATANETSGLELQISGSVHPNRRGYGDIARIVHSVLAGRTLSAF